MHFVTFVLVPLFTEKSALPGRVHDMLVVYYAPRFTKDYDDCYPPNPKAEWDECSIGGRWDGLISGHSIDEVLPSVPLAELWERNITKVINLPPNFSLPAAIVTPDGSWHDWYNDTKTHADEEWEPIAKSILGKHRDCFAVCIDCHR